MKLKIPFMRLLLKPITAFVLRTFSSLLTYLKAQSLLIFNFNAVSMQKVSPKLSFCLTIIVCSVLSNSLSAQKSESKYVITYDVATRAYTSVPTHQIKHLSTVDKVSLRLIEEKEHHDIEVFDSHEVVTTIKLLKSNKYEDWMQQPAQTVIDKNGSRCYDSEGGLLADVPHSEISKKRFDENALSMFNNNKLPFPDFAPINLQAIGELRKNGFTVQQGKKGRLIAKSATKLLVYDPSNKEIEERELQGNEVQYALRQKFTTNDLGQVVPNVKIEVTLEKGRDSLKFWRTVESKYTNYKMVVSKPITIDPSSSVFDKEAELLKINPNPTQNDIWVQIPHSMQGQAPTIRIFDVNGRQVFNQTADYVIQQITVNKLPNGVYLLQVETAKGAKVTQRFVKQ